STGFMQLRPHIITNETTLYLYYLMKSSLFLNQRDQYATGTTQVALTDNRARNILVPIAPLDMQKQIVADIEVLFSHIDAGIAALKKAKQLLEQYRQSVLKAAVTGELSKEWRQENGVNYDKSWQPLMLGDVADIIDPNPSHRYPPYDNGDVPLLATKQMVGDDDWDESTAKLTTTEFYEKRKSLHGFKSDDIIFARKGRLGLARRPPKLNHYAFSHTVFIVRGRSEINSDYLLWFLRREEVISWLLMEINVAAGVPTLGKAILKKLPLLLPSKEEQKFITEQLEKKITAICRISESIEIQLKKAEKNKQSILASAFTGRIN
ncbi:MAG: restriction endonuclease subunit S, partial [Gammaproteobacteria bacterium]|nr:restriction endonuclease subunit S [Gammaproteobacteria bacterium]